MRGNRSLAGGALVVLTLGLLVATLVACSDDSTAGTGGQSATGGSSVGGSGAGGDGGSAGAGGAALQIVEATAISADGQGIWYRAVGGSQPDAQTLVLLHGGPGLSHHYLVGFEALATADLGIVTYDQRGMGGSPADVAQTDFSIDRHIEDLDAVVDDLGVTSFALLGHSWGGFVAQSYAIAQPDRLDALVLLSSIPATEAELLAGMAVRDARIEALQAQGLIVDPLPMSSCDRLVAALPAYFHDPTFEIPPELVATECSPAVGPATFQACITADFDLTASLAALQLPVLVATGATDFFADFAAAHAAVFEPDATLEITPATGHFTWMEAPEATFDLIRGFVTPG